MMFRVSLLLSCLQTREQSGAPRLFNWAFTPSPIIHKAQLNVFHHVNQTLMHFQASNNNTLNNSCVQTSAANHTFGLQLHSEDSASYTKLLN